MIRRPVLVAVASVAIAASTVQHAFAQAWLQRYLHEHKPTADGSSQAQANPSGASQAAQPDAAVPADPEIRRALPVANTQQPASEPVALRALPADTPTEAPRPRVVAIETLIPVRRAEPVEPAPTPVPPRAELASTPVPPRAELASTPVPPRAELASTPVPPRAELASTPVPPRAVLASTPVPPRAEPFVTPAPTPLPVQVVPSQEPLPVVRLRSAATPTSPPSIVATPVAPIAVATPAPTPVATPTPAPDAPVLKPETAAQASPTPVAGGTDNAPEQLDPNNSVIRLSPGATPLPADINQINIANDLYAQKDYARAAPEYERYLNFFPTGADRAAATFRLAESYRNIGNFNAARQSYESLVFSYQDAEFVGAASYRLADICYQEKNYQDALTFYRKASVRVKDPEIALSAKFHASVCLDNLKYTEDAIRSYQDVHETPGKNPFREASTFALARLNASVGRKSEAILLLDALRSETDKDSVKAEAAVRKGLLLIDCNQNDKAVAELTKALSMPELGEWKETAELGILRVHYNSGKFQQVLDTYKTNGKEFSEVALPEVLLLVANSNRQLGKFEAARALFEQAIRDYPETVYAKEARFQRLLTLYNCNAPELLKEVDDYLATNPESGSQRDQLTLVKAEYLYKTKQYGTAAPVYATLGSSSLTPTLKAEALFKLGWCYTQVPDYPAAIAAFSSFLSQYPAHKLAALALTQRALSYQKSNNFKGALTDFAALIDRFPNAREREVALKQKGLILGQQEDNQAMVETFTQLLKEFPRSSAAGQANYWIGWVAIQNKNYKAAIAPLDAACKDKEFAQLAIPLLLAADSALEDRDATAIEVDKAIQLKVKVPSEVLRWLGMKFMDGDPKRADKYLSMLTARDGSEDVTEDDWLNLGRVQTSIFKWADAQKAINTYLKNATDPIPQATGYLALGAAQLGAAQLDEAEKSTSHVLELQPEGKLNSKGRMQLGDISMVRKDFETAAKLYLSVSILGAEDPVLTPLSLEKAYDAYKKAGNAAQAAKVLNELQSRYPEYQVKASSS